jgi:hypothetical protein
MKMLGILIITMIAQGCGKEERNDSQIPTTPVMETVKKEPVVKPGEEKKPEKPMGTLPEKPASDDDAVIPPPPTNPEDLLPIIPVEPGITTPTIGANFDWNNDEWSGNLMMSLRLKNIFMQKPKDIKEYCPQYDELDELHKLCFWGHLAVAMAKKESNYNSRTQFVENFNDSQGRPVISRGLFQMSFESANQRAYNCNFKTPQELHDPILNIKCMTNILYHWVSNDQRIGGKESGEWKGGARYWSVLRNNANTQFIKAKTIDFCNKAKGMH